MNLEAFVDGLDLAIVRFDEGGHGAHVNRAGAALLGRDAPSIAALEWLDAFHPDDHPVARAAYHAMREGGSGRACGAHGRRRGPDLRRGGGDGARARRGGGLRGAPARREGRDTGEAARGAESSSSRRRSPGRGATLEELVSIASHELGEPVRKVAAFAHLLREGSSERMDDTGRDYLARIERAARADAAAPRRICGPCRACRRPPCPSRRWTLREAALSVTTGLDGRLREAGARVTIGALPVVEADVFQMEQLLEQLVHNALRFCKPGEPPAVRIEATVEAGQETGRGPVARLTVSDEGHRLRRGRREADLPAVPAPPRPRRPRGQRPRPGHL